MSDAFQPYESYDAAAKKKPVVPEPASYGAIFLALVIFFILIKRGTRPPKS